MISSLFRRGHTRWLELASAYLDGELSPRDLARFERHLQGCIECQAALEHAEETHNLLAQLPELRAPRSFQLTPELLARPVARHEPGRGRPIALRLAQAATAVAVLAFATILTMDLAGAGSSNSHQALAPESLTEASTATDNHGVAAPVATSTVMPSPSTTVAALPPTVVPTAPPIVPPTTSDVGAQGFSPSPSPSPTPTATQPPPTPTATPTDAVDATGPRQDFGAHDDAAGGNPGSAEKRASGKEYYSTYRAASVTAGWYRPAEIALAIIAVAGLAATVVLGLRRRQ